jgi:hypothetical protein
MDAKEFADLHKDNIVDLIVSTIKNHQDWAGQREYLELHGPIAWLENYITCDDLDSWHTELISGPKAVQGSTNMNILGLNIPNGQRLWYWNCGGDLGTLFFATNRDEAYRKCIKARLNAIQGGVELDENDVENVRRWFSKNDTLEEVIDEYTGPTYRGALPDLD